MSDSAQNTPSALEAAWLGQDGGLLPSAKNVQILRDAEIKTGFIAEVIGVSKWQLEQGFTAESQLGRGATTILRDLTLTVKVLRVGGYDAERIEKALEERFPDEQPIDDFSSMRRMDCIKANPLVVQVWAHGEIG